MQMSEVPPPTERGPADDLGKPSSWPTVLGVIGIILASMGLVGGCCGLTTPLFWPAFIDWMSHQNVPQDQLDAMKASQPPLVWSLVSGVMSLALSSLLLAGSIGLMRRRESGVRLCTYWSWTMIPWAVLSYVVTLMIQLKVPTPPQQGGAIGKGIGIAFSSCMTVVLGIGLPIFFLAWTARATIKQEVASWSLMQRARV